VDGTRPLFEPTSLGRPEGGSVTSVVQTHALQPIPQQVREATAERLCLLLVCHIGPSSRPLLRPALLRNGRDSFPFIKCAPAHLMNYVVLPFMWP
jgi:hypothetical protein